jgi:hypothetical protein
MQNYTLFSIIQIFKENSIQIFIWRNSALSQGWISGSF